MAWLTLIIAIVAEVIATSALKASDGFTQLKPSLLTVAGYAVSFYCLSLTMRTMPTGVIYAIWSGMGIVLISAVAWIFFKQRLDLPAIIGMSLILIGVVVIQLFSKASHQGFKTSGL